MAQKSKSSKRDIQTYVHADKERVNNPPVGLVTSETDKDAPKKSYAYDPHLDPSLQWAGKAERTSFEIPTVSLHVHERIDPRSIIEAVRKKNGEDFVQGSLFSLLKENPPLREAIEFYKHAHNWSNRLVAGDSLLVMNSLLEKEGLAGQVQTVYFDPPYGIKYGSNFQPFVNKRDVKDGKDEDLTAEPEMIKAFRDTWELGLHSYLTYLRDRVLLARELLNESGSVFIQISDENVHHVREVMDEVFGSKNFIALIPFGKTAGAGAKVIGAEFDYLVWYGKDIQKLKSRQLYLPKASDTFKSYKYAVSADATEVRYASSDERADPSKLPKGWRLAQLSFAVSQDPGKSEERFYQFGGVRYDCGENRHWKTKNPDGLDKLAKANRLIGLASQLNYIRYYDDFPATPLTNNWSDTGSAGYSSSDPKVYVVQTDSVVVQRCLLMTTDPGDLVLDITCGSGTTAFVAEQWGRRWITCDTSRVALTLAKQRLMTVLFGYYQLAHPEEGVGSGFG
jgi:adenine-specific DNA-methyltransferase